MAVCLIRHLKTLAVFSTLGNVAMLIGFVIIFQQIFHPPNEMKYLPAFAGWETMIMAVGSMLYAIEGQASVSNFSSFYILQFLITDFTIGE